MLSSAFSIPEASEFVNPETGDRIVGESFSAIFFHDVTSSNAALFWASVYPSMTDILVIHGGVCKVSALAPHRSLLEDLDLRLLD